MVLFGGKKAVEKTIPNVTYEDFATLKARVTALELEYETLRNKVLRKIQERRQETTTPITTPLKPGQAYHFGS